MPAIAAATGAVFVFAGLGPELARVDALCHARDDCHNLGFLDSADELARWYASSDLCYALSAWETFGFSTIEAMASGVPVVAANQGAARDWVTRAGCGVTVPYGDVPALTQASIELLKRPDRAELGMRGRAFVAAHFARERAYERMLGYYRMLVAAGREGLDGFPYRLEHAPVG